MPDIRAFRGIVYNPEKVGDLSRVVTEPYDVISPSQQNAYYHLHPYNIIRLILGKRYPEDNHKNNQYTRAKKFFTDWQKRDILVRDKKESIYIYTQSFPHNNKTRTRTGFIVLLKLEDFAKNTILPHENTFSEPVNDRLQLLKTVQANLSPIFALFSEPEGKVNQLLSRDKKEQRPCIVFKKDNTVHKLWRISEKKKINTIKKLLKARQIFIADGHHRYEAALNYKMQMQKKRRYFLTATFNYVMTYLAPTTDRGLTILPTHRVVKIKAPFNFTASRKSLKKSFKLYKFSTSDKLFAFMDKSSTSRIFGAYFGSHQFYGLKLKNQKQVYKFINRDKPFLIKDLDVTILHVHIFGHILHTGSQEEDIYYTRDAQEAIKLVDEEKYQVAFFLKPTTLTQVQKVAQSGWRMPHKTTYFYPKLLSGLVINKLL